MRFFLIPTFVYHAQQVICPSLVVAASTCNSQHKVDNDRSEEGNRKYGRSESVVESALTSHPYALCSPVKGHQRVQHGSHGNQCEETCRYLTDLVAKVEKSNSKTAEDDGKVEPRKKGSLVCKEHLGLDASWEGDALALRLSDMGTYYCSRHCETYQEQFGEAAGKTWSW